MTSTIATSIIKRKKLARAAIRAALHSVEKKAVGFPGSGYGVPDMSVSSGTGAVAASKPLALPAQSTPAGSPTAWQQGVANSKRVGSGILNTVASFFGEGITAIPYGANEAWNYATPKDWNTSQIYSDTVKNFYHNVRANTDAAAADVYNGLGGDTNYFAPTASQRTEAATYDMPDPDGWLARIARGSGNVGDATWDAAQAVMTGRGAVAAASKVPGAAALATSAANATPAWLRTGVAYGTGLPTARVSTTGVVSSLLGQRVADSTLRALDARAGGNSNFATAADALPMNWFPNAASSVVGPEAAGYASQLTMAPTIGTGPGSLTYYAGFPALVEGIDVVARPRRSPEQLQYEKDLLLAGNQPATAAVPATDTPTSGADNGAAPPAGEEFKDPPMNPLLAAFPDEAAFSARFDQLDPEQQTRVAELVRQIESNPAADQSGPLWSEVESIMLPAAVEEAAAETPATETTQETPPAAAGPAAASSSVDLVDQAAASASSAPAVAQIPGVPADASPDVVVAAQATQTEIANKPEARAAIENPDSPEGQQTLAAGKQNFEQQETANYATRVPPPAGQQPQEFGEWLNGMMTHVNEMWESLGPMGQLAFGLGVPLGLIGLMGDGVGSFLLSAVGLGAAGTALAASGALGQTAQQSANSILSGLMPQNQKISPETPRDPSGTATAGIPASAAVSSPDTPAQKISPKIKNDAINAIVNARGLTDLAALSTNRDMAAAVNYFIAPENADELRQIISELNTTQRDNAKKILTEAAQSSWTSDAQKNIALNLLKMFPSTTTEKAGVMYIQNELMSKIARCWKGYEPVPGKKPYTDGSCRPAGSKQTKKQVKKKTASAAYALNQSAALLNIIRGYYVKQAYTQSTQIRPQSRPKTGA